MRIIAGQRRGHKIDGPRGRDTRPTSDLVRESMFNILRQVVADRQVIDLFAGTGALGLEALSRGSAHALFVESDRRAAAVLRRNVDSIGLPGAVVRVAPAGTVLAGPAERAYDLVLVDPPYDVPDAEVAGWLVAAAAHGWLAAGAVVVVERSARGAPFPWPPPLRALRERRYGETTLFLGELAGPVTWAVSVRG
jgi:16S rRNA (guanine966-N2)-methyltransferase